MTDLIIGANGLVGSALAKQLPGAILGINNEPDRTRGEKHIFIDVIRYETLFRAFSQLRPKRVFLTAAIANVDKCEDAGTSVVNVRGAITVLRLCEQFESQLIWFSSSYVFDGTKEEPYLPVDDTNPINNYGKQKETVENLIVKSDARFIIARTVGVFGKERMKKNFAKQVIRNIFAGMKVNVPDDQYMNPILSNDLAHLVIKLSERANGIFHVAGDTCVSKYEFAKRIASYFGYEKLIIPVSSDNMKQRTRRPKMGCLNSMDLLDVNLSPASLNAGLQKFLGSEFI